jgi:hypothetical protein
VIGEKFVLLSQLLTFWGQKVSKKPAADEKSYDFAFRFRPRQKNSPVILTGAFAPPMTFGSNSFWLHRPPTEQNRDFSKAAPVKDGWTKRFCHALKQFECA